jgi:protein translocase SecG subunit
MDILLILQIIISLALIGIILIQPPSSSVGSAFGANAARFHTKKGGEKFLFSLTFMIAISFVVISLLNIIL